MTYYTFIFSNVYRDTSPVSENKSSVSASEGTLVSKKKVTSQI